MEPSRCPEKEAWVVHGVGLIIWEKKIKASDQVVYA